MSSHQAEIFWSREGADFLSQRHSRRHEWRPDAQFAHGHQPSRSEIDAMHHEAHEACFIANSLRSDIRCEPVCA